ncbi:MAG: signal peptide peptidase SppA [Pseudomonadota bacterium]
MRAVADVESKPNIIVRLFKAIWGGLNGVRKVLHLVLLVFVFMLFFGLSGGDPVGTTPQGALTIRPIGALVEEVSGSPFDRAVAEVMGETQPQTRVQDVIDALRYAAGDSRIDAVHLELSSLQSGGLSKLQRVAAAMAKFQESGKPIIASADFLSQQSYYLAAHADQAHLNPHGLMLLQGYGRFRSYYKEIIDTLQLDWNVFRVGTHKTFVEPYTRTDMSAEDRESTRRLIDEFWELYRTDVVTARQLEPGTVQDFTNNLVQKMRDAGNDMAVAALNQGLIDALSTRSEMRALMIDLVGEDPSNDENFAAIEMSDYLSQKRLLDSSAFPRNVAVVVASGDILFGDQSPGTIGAESTSALLRRARKDSSVGAVVLRIDSPGGSAFAAEIIRDEIAALQAAGKPVVASMSSVAASGGYYIAMGTDKIFASPATVTGSIGVFAMFPTYQRTLETVGITTDGIGTTPLAGQLRPDRAMNDDARAVFQMIVEDTYDDFIGDVAAYREMEKTAVDAVGQGQVWSGGDALAHGLVDELGELDDAIVAAARLGHLGKMAYGVVTIEQELTATEQFIIDLLSVTAASGLELSSLVEPPTFVDTLARTVNDAVQSFSRFNDPRHVYKYCLCDIY